MKEGWEYKKLKDVATFTRGLTYSKKDEAEFSKNVVLRSNNVDLFSGKLNFDELKYLNSEFEIPCDKKVKKGSLLMCMSNGSKIHLGKVALIDDDYDYAFGGFMALVTPNEQLNPKFFHYSLSSPSYKDFIKQLSAGANINNIKVKELELFSIPIPPLSEQQEIVDYLDSAFAKIDAMKANAEKALEEGKALFQSALKQLLEPKEGWEEKKLKEIGSTQTGLTPSKSIISYYGGTIPFIRPAELNVDNNGAVEYNSELKLTALGAEKSRQIKANSIMMCCIGSVGKTAYNIFDVTCNQQINTITPNKDYHSKFIYYALIAPNFQNKVITIANSAKATLPIISKGKWENLSIFIPSHNKQQAIASVFDDLSKKTCRLQENYDKIVKECDTLKQAILRQVFE